MIAIQTIQTLDVYFFAFFVLILISTKALNSPNGKIPQSRSFSILILLNFMIIIADSVTVLFDGHSGPVIRFLMLTASVFGYCLQVLICLFWYWYARTVVFPDRKLLERRAIIQGFPAAACVLIAAASYGTGWIFRLDAQNVYHRGPLFAVIPAVSFLYLLFGYILIIRNRKALEKRHFLALISFALPPLIAGIIQTLLYGVNLLWPSMTFSLLIIYLSIQNELLLLDDLTGINNRRSFDYALRRRIAHAGNTTPFAVMLIDIENFRSINDRYGHVECDEVLKSFAGILGACFRDNGFVARYGGDEFAVIIEIRQLRELNELRDALQARIDEWNRKSGKPWRLSISLGYAPYIPSENLSQDNFIVHVDRLLCLDKIISVDHRFWGQRRP